MKWSFKGNAAWCHICGRRIPEGIADQNHPLFGTVDHVIPRRLQEKESIHNRRPAHLYCNQKKGGEPLTPKIAEECREAIGEIMLRYPVLFPTKRSRRVNQSVLTIPTNPSIVVSSPDGVGCPRGPE